ncbi:MAG TPA: PIG-L deacetylase family protein [Candidatus Acidoferrales bacterium]|nr:PIG-L deacetylase family protein [Candidatus Acidoferrales bacterium]
MARVLATILAHPDDETFGTGGTLIRYAADGVKVHSLCLTEGEQGWAGGDGAPEVPRADVGKTRALELAEAGRRMGVESVTCLKYPDGGLAGVNPDDVVRDIVRWLRSVRPDVVITWGPDGGYGHPDHIAAGKLALRAIDLAGIARHEPGLGDHVHVKRVYRFVAGAEFVDQLLALEPDFAAYVKTLDTKLERWTRERIGAALDVSAFMDRKWHAMQAHVTQTPDIHLWARVREKVPGMLEEELYIREYPDPHGPSENDLFAALPAG